MYPNRSELYYLISAPPGLGDKSTKSQSSHSGVTEGNYSDCSVIYSTVLTVHCPPNSVSASIISAGSPIPQMQEPGQTALCTVFLNSAQLQPSRAELALYYPSVCLSYYFYLPREALEDLLSVGLLVGRLVGRKTL